MRNINTDGASVHPELARASVADLIEELATRVYHDPEAWDLVSRLLLPWEPTAEGWLRRNIRGTVCAIVAKHTNTRAKADDDLITQKYVLLNRVTMTETELRFESEVKAHQVKLRENIAAQWAGDMDTRAGEMAARVSTMEAQHDLIDDLYFHRDK